MKPLDFILQNGEAWLQYAVKINFLGENRDTLTALEQQALADAKIKAYLVDITDFHSILVSNHKNPDLPIHKLLFLLDIGFDTSLPEIQIAINEILKHKDSNGVYQSPTNIPKHFGGSGEDMLSWCLCDAPLLLLALQKTGVDYETHIKQGAEYLLGIYKNQGFPCTVSAELGKFRGPGRKDDMCPYATLIMLKLLSEIPHYKDSDIAIEIIKGICLCGKTAQNGTPICFIWEQILEN